MFHPNTFINTILKLVFLVLDLIWIRKNPKLWVIAIPETDRFDGNVRAIYELCRSRPEIIAPAQIKLILTEAHSKAIPAEDRVACGVFK